MEIEERATEIRWWEPLLVPGLLQTPEYARAVLASWRRDNGDDIEAKVTARIERQAILDRDNPPELRALLDESVLYRCVGSAAVMAEAENQDARRGCPREVISTRALAARTASESVLMS